MGRSPCCDKSKVKRGSWSPEEDEILKTHLLNHGTGGNWIALPQKAGLLRCGKSCRLRWLNYLRPDIKHGAFTQDEDDIIINIYNKIGSRWSAIASHLPGRTDNDVKNHWNTKLRKKLMAPNNNTKITTTTKTTAFQASIDPLISPTPKFPVQFPGMSTSYDQPMNFHSPRFIHDGPNSTSPFTMAHQDSDSLRISFSWMNENYGVDGIPNQEFSFDFMNAVGSHSDADLFSIFQFDYKSQGASQSR